MAAGRWLFSSLTGMITRCLQRQPSVLTAGNMAAIVTASLTDFFLLVLPVFLIAVASGLVVNYAQVGFLFTAEPLLPQLSRLDPVAGFKRMFSKRSLFELVKSLLKVTFVAFIAFNYIHGTLEKMLLVLYQSTSQIWDSFSTLFTGLALRVGTAFIVLAAADYLYQRYEHENDKTGTERRIQTNGRGPHDKKPPA
jgi:flagellar biosynthetic protein FlhB